MESLFKKQSDKVLEKSRKSRKVIFAFKHGFGIRCSKQSPSGRTYYEKNMITLKEKLSGYYIKPEHKQWKEEGKRILTKEDKDGRNK